MGIHRCLCQVVMQRILLVLKGNYRRFLVLSHTILLALRGSYRNLKDLDVSHRSWLILKGIHEVSLGLHNCQHSPRRVYTSDWWCPLGIRRSWGVGKASCKSWPAVSGSHSWGREVASRRSQGWKRFWEGSRTSWT